MSYGTSDSTVISSTKPEAHNFNTVNASAAQRDDGSPATTLANSHKNRQEIFLVVVGVIAEATANVDLD